ncbi:MAG: MBL fold metallo-hydrolase [Verrucomicrobiales bacterium]|nr:MBL fold metallo-hydrolase [Verrucomicrobiales bacterium]
MRFLSAVFVFALAGASCSNQLGQYEDFLVGEPAATTSKNPGKVSISYFGTNSYLIEHGSTAIAVDPYFSRTNLRTVALNGPMSPDVEEIEAALKKAAFPASIDVWLVTHSHFDHLLDIPELQKRFGGKIITSETGKHIAEAVGTRPRNVIASGPGGKFRFGTAAVTVLDAGHDRLFGRVPYLGVISEPLENPPSRAKDWKLGQPLAYLIEIGGKRIYIESGGIRGKLPDSKASGVDLAIMGVAVWDSQARYPEAAASLDADFILPSHQDDFFKSLERGFHFAPTSNFPKVLAGHREAGIESELILMDFFTRWELP